MAGNPQPCPPPTIVLIQEGYGFRSRPDGRDPDRTVEIPDGQDGTDPDQALDGADRDPKILKTRYREMQIGSPKETLTDIFLILGFLVGICAVPLARLQLREPVC